MSDLVRTLNLIKTQRNPTWLTASQLEAFTAIRTTLQVPGSVNLYGTIGVGKTFLAWALAEELGYLYFPHITYLQQVESLNTVGVVLDNCFPHRQSHRDTLKALQFLGISRAVLVTIQMIDDYTHYVELKLTNIDRAKVQSNLGTLGLYNETDQVPNLWHLVNSYL